MVEENNSDLKSFVLEGVLEDYSQWFSDIVVSMTYLETSPLPEGFSLPLSFREWVSKNQNNREINPSALKSLSNAHYSMRVASESVIAPLLERQRPDYKMFVEFKNLYNLFLSQLHSQENLKTEGEDVLDGLRPLGNLQADLDREMERLSRSDNPFALACARIDEFSAANDQNAALMVAKNNIIKSVRPFDDVYYLGDGEFLLSLKHTDVVGGEVALIRMQRSLAIDAKNTVELSLSFCLSEPVTGDEISGLINNMKNDLDNHKEDKDVILKFLDISPLERFIGSKK